MERQIKQNIIELWQNSIERLNARRESAKAAGGAERIAKQKEEEERKTEAEAKAWVEKNARYNWHYEVYVEESHEPTWWEMEGYLVNPENVKYNYPDD